MPVLNKHHGPTPPGAIFIGRGSAWGNPYKITKTNSRAAVIAAYEALLLSKIKDGTISVELMASLHDKALVCYCSPAQCHGDVLLEYAARAYGWLQAENNYK